MKKNKNVNLVKPLKSNSDSILGIPKLDFWIYKLIINFYIMSQS